MNEIYNKTIEKQNLQAENISMNMSRHRLSARIKSNSQKIFNIQKDIDKLILENGKKWEKT